MNTDSTGKVQVSRKHKYKKIDKDSPRHQKCIWINTRSGVAYLGEINDVSTRFATHWAPLPTFEDNEEC